MKYADLNWNGGSWVPIKKTKQPLILLVFSLTLEKLSPLPQTNYDKQLSKFKINKIMKFWCNIRRENPFSLFILMI